MEIPQQIYFSWIFFLFAVEGSVSNLGHLEYIYFFLEMQVLKRLGYDLSGPYSQDAGDGDR